MANVPVQYINPFFAAVKSICVGTLKVPLTSGPLRLQRADERLWKLYPISASIHLRSAVDGVISLCFSEPMALALVSRLMSETISLMNDDARDALGEVTNLIIGTAKRDMPGGLVEMSTPMVLPTHKIDLHGTSLSLLLPFEAAAGRFVMKVSILKVTAATAEPSPPLALAA